MEYVLRDYQNTAVDAALDSLTTKKNGILVLPTGSGKSLIIAAIAKRSGQKIIVLQPTKEILEQNRNKIRAFGIYNIGVYSASMNRRDFGTITFATIGSVFRKKELFESFDLIIVDECHAVNSKGGMYEKFIKGLGHKTLGLTATPYRMKNYADMRTGEYVAESRILTRTRPRIFNKIVHITQVKDLFTNNYLCRLDYSWQNDYDSKQIKATSTQQGYDEKALKKYNRQQKIPDKIIDEVANFKGNHCLAFTKFTSESAQVINGLNKKGISCAEVSATTKKKNRAAIIRGFRSGRIRCVVNVGVLTTGFDFPELDCIVIGRPTKSVALYYQIVGRGVRIADGKQSCLLIDLCDNVKRFGYIETFEIVDRNGNEMWRLQSNVGALTGVDVATGRDLESIKRRASRTDKKQIDNGNLKITFGKYEGKNISEVDDGYLKWAANEFRDGRWKKLFQYELERRQKLA